MAEKIISYLKDNGDSSTTEVRFGLRSKSSSSVSDNLHLLLLDGVVSRDINTLKYSLL